MKTILPFLYFLFSISILHAQNPEWINQNTENRGLVNNIANTIVPDCVGNQRIGHEYERGTYLQNQLLVAQG